MEDVTVERKEKAEVVILVAAVAAALFQMKRKEDVLEMKVVNVMQKNVVMGNISRR